MTATGSDPVTDPNLSQFDPATFTIARRTAANVDRPR